MEETFSLPRLNEPAPDFVAKTTAGELRLSDLKGKWVVLFSHPADFTPVCSTEFLAFAKRQKEFEELGVQLLGLSIDSIHAHLAWLRDLEEMSGITINFPVIADLDMKVSKLYGMIHPAASETAAVRAVFIIDPNGILRGMLYYPLTTGRNIDEILRFIRALQFTDRTGLNTPADWQPGQPAIVKPPATLAELKADEAKKAEYTEYRRWYLRLKRAE
ncbi:MAG: peroxiredoxin [Thermus sp.]|uniref:peroxiredoxin n=1 Tax=unclassified Thermus TaxID=2619321 RepID=UPI0002389F71|nr:MULTISPECIES: peroxiredoxin [unclassified Thermus]AEV16149.1 Peroxiredoxin [Thermus sp. CCB_US3_UF1]MCS6868912.1 peroxiredoxin [Thermus sp.]MCS7218779.1 peroxiredoxin [Thermus sp.]MCX7848986.1 peroxiredoxin [Thermus sp.]MDW8017444.1 peroxiredoxin [Thermus sp.]